MIINNRIPILEYFHLFWSLSWKYEPTITHTYSIDKVFGYAMDSTKTWDRGELFRRYNPLYVFTLLGKIHPQNAVE